MIPNRKEIEEAVEIIKTARANGASFPFNAVVILQALAESFLAVNGLPEKKPENISPKFADSEVIERMNWAYNQAIDECAVVIARDYVMITKTKVVHCKKEPYDIYIGRPEKWGNPFFIGCDGTRKEVIEKYREYIINNKELLKDLSELKGKILGCWCKPKKCHGDILVELIEKM